MKGYLFVVFLFVNLVVIGQRDHRPAQLSHYILDSFTRGEVLVKSGERHKQTLNYNILTGEFIFNDQGRYLAIATPSDVDTIFIRGRQFVPVDNKFYEVLTKTKLPLLLEFSFKIEEPTVSVGYGNASPTTNATTFNSLVRTNGVYDLRLPDDFKVIPVNHYWLKVDGKYEKFSTQQQLIKLIPGKKDLIKELAKKYHTNFSHKNDLARLVQEVQQ
jgi:hypothetical protein